MPTEPFITDLYRRARVGIRVFINPTTRPFASSKWLKDYNTHFSHSSYSSQVQEHSFTHLKTLLLLTPQSSAHSSLPLNRHFILSNHSHNGRRASTCPPTPAPSLRQPHPQQTSGSPSAHHGSPSACLSRAFRVSMRSGRRRKTSRRTRRMTTRLQMPSALVKAQVKVKANMKVKTKVKPRTIVSATLQAPSPSCAPANGLAHRKRRPHPHLLPHRQRQRYRLLQLCRLFQASQLKR